MVFPCTPLRTSPLVLCLLRVIVVIHIPVGNLTTIHLDTAIAYNYLQEESSGLYSLFVQTGRFIFAPSRTPLHRRLVGINISNPEGHGLALPLLIRLAFH